MPHNLCNMPKPLEILKFYGTIYSITNKRNLTMTLYISDLDGTLLNSDCKLKPVSAEILNRLISKGVLFTYATARSFATAFPLTSSLQLNTPVITNNGVFICNPSTGEHIISHYFSAESKFFAKEYFENSEESPLIYSYINNTETVSYLSSRKKSVKSFLDSHKNDKRLRPCNDFEQMFEGEIFYITLISPKTSSSELDKYFYNVNGLTRLYVPDTYIPDEYWYEIQNKNVSKANAVIELKQLLKAEKVVCFGDNLNDISMFKVADESYAVLNACDDLISIATDIIPANNQNGVAVFIEKNTTQKWRYDSKPIEVIPDKQRFQKALELAKEREIINIGTLNEKCIHATLKNYFSDTEYDQEIKIGGFFADILGENGIIEIQSKCFNKLNSKLNTFLDASHVTVVYPFHKKTRIYYIDKSSGELIKHGNLTSHKNLTDFFIELYRIKSYLNNPNLTICIANLEVEKYRYTAQDCVRRKGQRVEVYPSDFISAIYLEKPEDYRMFLPKDLPEFFTKKEFQKICNFSEASILIEILEYMGIVSRFSKQRNEFIYRITI